ncbi:hypothetical protein MPC4_30018 [Methylocella tundrae]|uniref:Uncharacterized protein n=1 Tax=Methylocella tundrae TaxID=227605 RepID=A0A8B6M9W1_METTU|nr:hypothetical protein MPC1_4850002 [Methylocella tundrae]VTZ50834.1 hypothetical protein MPC4_30018 [Methylocella tundrae]
MASSKRYLPPATFAGIFARGGVSGSELDRPSPGPAAGRQGLQASDMRWAERSDVSHPIFSTTPKLRGPNSLGAGC